MAALKMKVNGLVHKGKVIVTYNEGTDYYEIYLLNRQGECILTREDVCFDELGQMLDELIEKPKDMDDETYKNKTKSDLFKNLVEA